ncbi:MAG TPA: type I glyceraldehyde-3-phosphate dehydrogenase, partial [Firmicutes bacterium]|nr:type I glyceraldehyde-3-phosphate dehydrogenase [Bacillota bacterium]
MTMGDDDYMKVFAWYDNEWGYSCRIVDMAKMIGQAILAKASGM